MCFVACPRLKSVAWCTVRIELSKKNTKLGLSGDDCIRTYVCPNLRSSPPPCALLDPFAGLGQAGNGAGGVPQLREDGVDVDASSSADSRVRSVLPQ